MLHKMKGILQGFGINAEPGQTSATIGSGSKVPKDDTPGWGISALYSLAGATDPLQSIFANLGDADDSLFVGLVPSLVGCTSHLASPFVADITTYSDEEEYRFLNWFFLGNATSGTHRGIYAKLHLTGGAGGETLRSVCSVETASPADTCNGAHISLIFGASAGNITGLGTAVRATVMVGARSITGTVASVMAELYGETDGLVGGTMSLFRGVVGGDSTAVADIVDKAYFLDLSATAGADHMVSGVSLKSLVNGAEKWIPYLPAVTEAQILGVGSEATPYALGTTANKNALAFRFTNTAVNGTSRGIYNRLVLSSGAGGESLRSYTECENNTPADTVNGAHISLGYGASAGNCTGQADGLRVTFHGAYARTLGGTTGGIRAELWAEATAPVLSNFAYFTAHSGGNATGVTAQDLQTFLLRVNSAAASNAMVKAGATLGTAYGGIKVQVNGTTMYMPLYASAPS